MNETTTEKDILNSSKRNFTSFLPCMGIWDGYEIAIICIIWIRVSCHNTCRGFWILTVQTADIWLVSWPVGKRASVSR